MCVALIYATTVLLWNGSHDEAGALVARLENLAERHALAPYQACARALRGELMAVLGEHEAAVPVLEDALARLDRENHQIMSSRASNALARALTKVGRLDQARTVVDAAIDLAARSGGKHDLSELLRTQAEIRLRTGDTTGAEAALREAVAVADEQGAVSWRLRCGEALASLQLSRGRRAAARAETARLTALLDGCAPSELQTAARERLRALRAAADRSAATRHSLARRA
jgi:ATP/maltotriose-dependent transcriptional regulator MalT